jgi:hypothetical protein
MRRMLDLEADPPLWREMVRWESQRVLGLLLGGGYWWFILSCFGQIVQADTDPAGRFIMPQARYGHAVSLYFPANFPTFARRC